MKRRDALKAIAVASVAVTSLSAYDEKLIINKKDMTPKDPKNMTKGELKHTPQITVGKADEKGYSLVEVNIGKEGIIHPSDEKHWIYNIVLFADDKKVSSVDLEPVISRGHLSARVNLKDVKKLKAISRCNLHGNYTEVVAL